MGAVGSYTIGGKEATPYTIKKVLDIPILKSRVSLEELALFLKVKERHDFSGVEAFVYLISQNLGSEIQVGEALSLLQDLSNIGLVGTSLRKEIVFHPDLAVGDSSIVMLGQDQFGVENE